MSQLSQAGTSAGDGDRERGASVGRLQGLALIAAVALPIVAAYVVYYTGLGMPDGTVNQGQLVEPPVDVKGLTLQEYTDRPAPQPLSLGTAPAKWRYLILPDGPCEGACESLLYTSRQVHIRLSEKAERVERLFASVVPLPAEQQAALAAEHPRLRFVSVESGAYEALRTDSGARAGEGPRLLLVDQEGFAMMRYDNENTGNELLKDIKRLLKYSYEQ
ncbi:hypothetical protein AWR36_011000 [Microbulbifer flavimaris]|uniref:Cytochrome oxidase Cu insertion factor, SCO1/SenC/PrrC family n=1 Tax=Microbulbifer flavimaris TaxID=1781068 RepID=A0ABX4HZM1_9GAMM|nr:MULTISPECIES: hypothetical protein [Microbulbifer]KUJ83058.1 hypothetical protein AVO43_10980 [Microbulbifer sp. ZGT114]PCO05243.1 hypothetical protein AWR36_011000 [Microbulbifer flavimaris]